MKLIEEKNECIKKDIIIDQIMRSKGVYILVSQPKVGKSMLALQLSDTITNGNLFLGYETFQSPVLYISTESDFGQLKARLTLLGLTPKQKSLFIIDRNGKPNISIFDFETDIYDFANNYNGKVVIIDMLKDIDFGIDYDINSYQDVGQKLMPKIRNLCDKYNITILFTHHLNKQNNTLGSTAFDASVDGILNLSEQKNDKNHLTLNIVNRDFPSIKIDLKRNINQTFSICNPVDDDELDYNLIILIKYLSKFVDYDFTCTEIVNKANLNTTPKRLGKLINTNLDLLKSEGINITYKRTSDKRCYHSHYIEPSE